MTDLSNITRSVGIPILPKRFPKHGGLEMTSEVLKQVTVSLTDMLGNKELVTDRVTAK